MELQVGDVGLSTIGGWTGAWIAGGMAIIGDGCRYTHARIAVGNSMGTTIYLEAMPAGARLGYVHEGETPPGVWYRLPLGPDQAGMVQLSAPDLVGTPYGFSDYLALALHHLAPHSPLTAGVRRYVQGNGRMICSQLVDHLLCQAGYHLFTDGRLPQDVTPGDLFYALTDQGVRVV